MTSASDKVMVATADDALIGCSGCHVLELLHAPGRLGRITALVVASTHQRQGVGGGLVAAAEAFFRSLGCVRVEVTSGNHRAGAHAFYTSLGFSESNTRFIESLWANWRLERTAMDKVACMWPYNAAAQSHR
jgi:GNAT superfamily N-acetyltransferase